MLSQGLLNEEERLLVKDIANDFRNWLLTGKANYIVGKTAPKPAPKKRPAQKKPAKEVDATRPAKRGALLV